jgi:ribonuclease E
VSEVTSLGLVQMTRKRLGTGLLEAFSTTCTACAGRGIIVHQNPVEVRTDDQSRPESGSKRSRKAKKRAEQAEAAKPAHSPSEHPMFRAMAAHSHEPGQADCSGDEALDTMPVDDASSADGMVAAALVAEDIEIVVTTDGADVDSGADAPIADAPITDVPAATVDEAVITTGGAQAPESAVSDDAPAEDGEIRTAEPATTGESGARGQDTAEPGDDAGNDRQAAGQDTVAPEPARASGTGSRRRRVVRVSSPTTTTEPVVMTSAPVTGDGDSAPVTTSGPSTAAPAAKTVAVRRRPRRRSAGRPAGPPVEE